MIGNGLMNYDFNAGNGNPSYDLFIDKLDGFCMEHLMAFEVTAKTETCTDTCRQPTAMPWSRPSSESAPWRT